MPALDDKSVEISKRQARRLVVRAAGLHQTHPFGKGKSGVLQTILHLGYIQIDTISVVERAHHHILWSRVPTYRPQYLHDLQVKDRKIFEYWAHAASYLPIEHYRFTHHLRRYFKSRADSWPKPDSRVSKLVYERIREEGPLMARDFAADRTLGREGGWWDFKPAKLALERLFLEGDLMVSERRGFQKVYDLRERILPRDLDVSAPSDDQYADYLIDHALQTHGIVQLPEISYLRRGIAATVAKRIGERQEEGDIVKVQVQGEGGPFFSSKANIDKSCRLTKALRILSPFDNVTIQRGRLKCLFDFDYTIECYMPKSKRRFGYFCLPILYGDQFVGRLDAKADRKEHRLLLRNLVMEASYQILDFPQTSWQAALWQFAHFNGCVTMSAHEMPAGSTKNQLISYLQEI